MGRVGPLRVRSEVICGPPGGINAGLLLRGLPRDKEKAAALTAARSASWPKVTTKTKEAQAANGRKGGKASGRGASRRGPRQRRPGNSVVPGRSPGLRGAAAPSFYDPRQPASTCGVFVSEAVGDVSYTSAFMASPLSIINFYTPHKT